MHTKNQCQICQTTERRMCNTTATPCINSESGMAVTVIQEMLAEHSPGLAIPPFVFIKSYY